MRISNVSKEAQRVNGYLAQIENFAKMGDDVPKSQAEVSKFKSGKGKVYGIKTSGKQTPSHYEVRD